MQFNFWNPGNLPENHIFDAGLSGRGHGNRVAVAAEAGCDPQDVELGNRIFVGWERHPLLRGRTSYAL